MKVGLLTFHDAYNYGAALQVYATQVALNNMDGISCDVVDYKNDGRRGRYSFFPLLKSFLLKKDFKNIVRLILGYWLLSWRGRHFRRFYKNRLICTDETYYTPQSLSTLNEKYDKFIVGSDQVWNSGNNGEDISYLLDFVSDKNKKISYSSSFGCADIPEHLKKDYIRCLNDIMFLSTREEFGVELIKKYTGRDAELVLDPVFLPGRQFWIDFAKKEKPIKKKYIFAYTNRKDQISNLEKQIDLHEYQMCKLTRFLTLHDLLSPRVKICYSMPLEKFVSLIANADFVFTASFHCTALSIILHVPFISVLTGDEGKDSRVKSLLKITGLENRVFTENLTLDAIKAKIDYDLVDKRLAGYREKSINFLKQSLAD